ncbi:unnamed protein product [Leuciscus chuanchicus]
MTISTTLDDSGGDEETEDWDDLAEEDITFRVACFLAKLKAQSNQTSSAINYMPVLKKILESPGTMEKILSQKQNEDGALIDYIDESFVANSVCRLCKIHKPVLHSQTTEDPNLLRNALHYSQDLQTNNPTETGLKRRCILDELAFFSVVDNVTPDIMHDILEGVGPLELLTGRLFKKEIEIGSGQKSVLQSVEGVQDITGSLEDFPRSSEVYIPSWVKDIREILRKSGGATLITSLDRDRHLSLKERRQMVRLLVSHLMESFGETPSAEIKKEMALALTAQFPCLKNNEGHGYESWYTPGRYRHPATGYLEERLRNVRKRLRAPHSQRQHSHPQPSQNSSSRPSFPLPDSSPRNSPTDPAPNPIS